MNTDFTLWTPGFNNFNLQDFTPNKTRNGDIELAVSCLQKNQFKAAKSILAKAVKENHNPKEAHFLLGILAIKNNQYNSALDHLFQADTPKAHYVLGALFINGFDGNQNIEKGLHHLKLAADGGFRRAKIELGAIYYFGLLNQEKNAKGAEYVQLFSPAAMSTLSNISIKAHHAYIEIVPTLAQYHMEALPSTEETVSLINRVAHQNCGKKIYRARDIWKIALEKSNSQDLKPLQAKMYVNLGRAEYSTRNYNLAIQHWQSAADAGDIHGMYYLGLATCSGKGVKKNLDKGKQLLQKSADAGYLPARAMLNQLDKKEPGITDSSSSAEPKELYPFRNKEKEHCIYANKSTKGKIWSFIKNHSLAIAGIALASAVGLAVIATVVAGLVALTIFFPHVMIPIYGISGTLVALGVGAIGLIGAAFAAGGH